MRAQILGQWEVISKYLKQARDPTIRHRLAALGSIACGNSICEVARWFSVSRQTLYNWMERLVEGGFDPQGLADQPRSGRPSQWNGQLDVFLKTSLESSPKEFGYAEFNWTVGLLQEHLASHAGQSFSEHSVRRQLHELGYVWNRPRYILEADPQRDKKKTIEKEAAGIA